MTTPAPAVSATDVRKSYGKGETSVLALAGVSIEVPRGQMCAVMGPSGSGKSTLMHCLAGLDTIDSGSISIGGTSLDGMHDKALTQLRRDRLGFVFQQFNLLPTLTAEENITLPLDIAGRKPDTEWMSTVVKAIGLEDRLKHRPSELSGGQQQRVACARALVTRPDVIFADEPTGNLDSATGQEIIELFSKLHQGGLTVLAVTHEERVSVAAQRVLTLREGRLA